MVLAGAACGPRAETSGIAVLPGQKLTIIFARGGEVRAPGPAGRVRVSLSEDPEVQIQAPSGAASFTTKADFVLIGVRNSSATFEVRIPRSAPSVEIQVDDDRVFLKDGSRIITSGSTNAAGDYILPLPAEPSFNPGVSPRG